LCPQSIAAYVTGEGVFGGRVPFGGKRLDISGSPHLMLPVKHVLQFPLWVGLAVA